MYNIKSDCKHQKRVNAAFTYTEHDIPMMPAKYWLKVGQHRECLQNCIEKFFGPGRVCAKKVVEFNKKSSEL